jgi:transcriptional regulator with XRE-family HTH domain
MSKFTGFGSLIRTHRLIKKHGISNTTLAQDLGCSAAQISNIETGKTVPDFAWVIKCIRYFALNDEETIAFFREYFALGPKITLDKKYLSESGEKWLIDLLTAIFLYPPFESYKDPANYSKTKLDIGDWVKKIYEGFRSLGKIREFREK